MQLDPDIMEAKATECDHLREMKNVGKQAGRQGPKKAYGGLFVSIKRVQFDLQR